MAENEVLERQVLESQWMNPDWLEGSWFNEARLLLMMLGFGISLQIACAFSTVGGKLAAPLLCMMFRTLMQVTFVFWAILVGQSHGIGALAQGLFVWTIGWGITIAFIVCLLHHGQHGIAMGVIEMSTPSEWWGVDRIAPAGSADRSVIALFLAFAADVISGLTVTRALLRFISHVVERLRKAIEARRNYA
jgi:hypothetical protein